MKKYLSWSACRIIVLLLFLLSFSDSYAQNGYEDVLYLKNGKILKGKILKIEEQRIEFATNTGNVVIISMLEVKQIRREPTDRRLRNAKDSIFKAKGFVTVAELSYSYGTGSVGTRIGSFRNQMKGYDLSISRGYLIAPTFYMGLGAGYNYYEDIKFLPIFLDLRSDFFRERFRPIFALRIGHSFGWKDNQNGVDWGGFMIQTNLGVKLMLSYSSSVYLSVGIKSQQVKVPYFLVRNNGTLFPTSEKIGHQFFVISAGFNF